MNLTDKTKLLLQEKNGFSDISPYIKNFNNYGYTEKWPVNWRSSKEHFDKELGINHHIEDTNKVAFIFVDHTIQYL